MNADAPEFVPASKMNADAAEFVPAHDRYALLRRIYTPLAKPNLKALEFPLGFINCSFLDMYKMSEIARGFVDEEPCDVGDFPKNIAEYYWIHEGERDEETWHLLCRLDNGLYAYYSASCDYTGFDCQGMMRLFVSRSALRIFEEAMTKATQGYCKREKLEGVKVRDTNKRYEEWKKNW